MAFYDAETLTEFEEVHRKWQEKKDDLLTGFLVRSYRTEKASEYARHGLSRRIMGLSHCIDRIFQTIPPDGKTSPSRDDLLDTTAFLQSFLINTFGTLDNLARIWVCEDDTRQSNGAVVPDGHIGLGPKNLSVRASLSADFQEYLKSANSWFEYLENYRHALAHRIPLYIPPKTLNEEEGNTWRELETKISDALRAGNYQAHDEIFAQQTALGKFLPMMSHSFGDHAKPVKFHGQTICDFATVIEVGEHMLRELDVKVTVSN